MLKLVQVEHQAGWFGRLDVRTKFAMLLTVALLGVLLDNVRSVAALALLVLLLLLGVRLSGAKLRLLAGLVLLSAWGTMWTQAIFYTGQPQTPLFHLIPPGLVNPDTPLLGGLWKGVTVTYQGALHGLAQSLRLVTPMVLGLLVFWTEDPSRMLAGLRRLRLPYEVAFMVMTCLRFIPITFAEARVTLDAQRLRRYRPFTFWGTLTGVGLYRTTRLTLVPLLANSVRKSTQMARSAESRGFRAHAGRTEAVPLVMARSDWLLCSFCLAAVLLVAAGRVLVLLLQQGVMDLEALAPVYWFVRKYL